MGSRYYRDAPPPRWDRERFEREDRFRAAPVIERDRYEYERDRTSRGGFEERFFAEERYGPPARRPERQYYDEEVFERRGPPPGDAMIPYRPRREEAPPRPGIIRRQSSLDTFDRRPGRRFDDYDDYRPPPVHIPVAPRRGPRLSERDVEEIRVAEPDYYGDEEFRTYREREWTNRRARRGSSRERVEEIIEEAPWPRRGKTKMPRAKVHTRAIVELGYPYEEEVGDSDQCLIGCALIRIQGETIILLKALNKAQIDEVMALSQEFRERDVTTSRS